MTPLQNEIVLVAGGEEFEVELSVTDSTIAVGRFIEVVAGMQPQCVLLDGFPVPVERPLGELAMVRGSRLEALRENRDKPVCMLIGLSGTAAA